MIVDKNLSLNHHLNIQNQNALIYLSYLEALPKNGLRPFFYEFVLTINSLKIMVMGQNHDLNYFYFIFKSI